MRLALLATGDGWHVRDLRRAGARLGIDLVPVDFRTLTARIAERRCGPEPVLASNGFRLDDADAVLVRTMPGGSLEQVVFRMDALHALEASGVRIVNRPRALETAIDKYLSLSRLAARGLPVPRTTVSERAVDALCAFEHLGGDVVSKPLFGSEGRGLVRLSSRAAAAEHFGELESAGRVIYQQQFVDHPGWDLRILVIGGEVVGSMRRSASAGWITNVARGGHASPTAPEPAARELAIRACVETGAEIGGVDLVWDRQGRHWVLEVNAVPGWRALASVCHHDFALEILRYAASAGERS